MIDSLKNIYSITWLFEKKILDLISNVLNSVELECIQRLIQDSSKIKLFSVNFNKASK